MSDPVSKTTARPQFPWFISILLVGMTALSGMALLGSEAMAGAGMIGWSLGMGIGRLIGMKEQTHDH